MSTILWLLAAQLVFLSMGLGITSRCKSLRESGFSLLLAPVVGHAAFILLSIRLSTSFVTGRLAVLLSFATLTLTTLLSLRTARQAVAGFARIRGLWWLAAACCAIQALTCLPAIAVGIDTYNGYGNLDAWYYTMDTCLLKDLRFFDVRGPQPFQMSLHSAGPATRVGPQFGVMLLAILTPLDELASFNLLLASFLWLIPVSVGFLCREVLELDLKWTLLGILLASIHSSLQLAYCSQHLGHVFALAAIPLAIATFYLAVTRPGASGMLVAGVLGAGCVFAYWPSMPLYAGPTGLVVLWLLATGRAALRRIALYGLSVLLLVLASSPEVSAQFLMATARANRFVVTRNDPVMIAFNPYLTEDLLPISTGLVDSGTLSSLWLRVRPEQYPVVMWTVTAHLLAAVAIIALMLLGLASELARRRPVVPAAMAVSLGLMLYVLRQEYGYGLYKLVSWSHVMASACLLLGLRVLWSRGAGRGQWLGRLAGAGVLVVYLFLNARTSYLYAARSTSPETGRFATLQGFSGNRDWRTLEDWGNRYADGPILIGLHQHVAQYWASFRLRRARYVSLVPQDVLGAVSPADQAHTRLLAGSRDPGPLLTLQPEAASQCRYFLDWSRGADVTRNRVEAAPLESNDTFRLYRLEHVSRFLSLYDGWYSLENNDPITGRRGAFRWMKQDASLLLFRFPRKPVRLVMGLRAGLGFTSLERTVSFFHDGKALGGALVEGGGRVVSEPFVPSAGVAVVEIKVKEPSRPVPRKFSLWNRWVQQDPRRLALGVYDIRAVEEAELAAALRPTQGSYGPQEVREALIYDGLHSDDWLGTRFRLGLPAGSCRAVRVGGKFVRLGDADLPARVAASVNGVAARETVIKDYGDFAVGVDIPGRDGGGLDWIDLEFEKHLQVETFHSPGQDLRQISALLRSVELVRRDEKGIAP